MSDILTGDVKLRRLLRLLPSRVQKRVMRTALKAAAKPLTTIAKARARAIPRRTPDVGIITTGSGGSKSLKPLKGKRNEPRGTLARSIGTVKFRTYQNGDSVVRIGPRKGFRVPDPSRSFKEIKYIDPRHYLHILEFGAWNTPARPILRPAMMQAKPMLAPAMAAIVRKGIDRETKKLRIA